MKTEFNDHTLTFLPKGRIDSSNAAALEQEVLGHIRQTQPAAVVFDAEALDYISSAGLRVLLKVKKTCADTSVVNVSSDIYEIFEMTGFTEILKVEKAFRIFDVNGCEVIGEGANGIVYRVDNDIILKVYKSADSLEAIKRERELSRAAFVLGIPTAIPYDVVKVGNSYGSVFELLSARSFAELLREDPSQLAYVAKETVSLAKSLHRTKAPALLPLQSDIARDWLTEAKPAFDEAHFSGLCALINAIPETGTMIHGDLHIKNVMQQGDEALLIDMDTLCSGHPVYELAFIYNAYEGFGICDRGIITRFLGIDAALAAELLDRILSLYLETADAARISEVKEKIAVIGLLRVLRRVIHIGAQDTQDGRELIEVCRTRINASVDHLDTLVF